MAKYQIIYQISTFDDEHRQLDFEVIRSKRIFNNYEDAEKERKKVEAKTPRIGWNALGGTETIVGLREVVEED